MPIRPSCPKGAERKEKDTLRIALKWTNTIFATALPKGEPDKEEKRAETPLSPIEREHPAFLMPIADAQVGARPSRAGPRSNKRIPEGMPCNGRRGG